MDHFNFCYRHSYSRRQYKKEIFKGLKMLMLPQQPCLLFLGIQFDGLKLFRLFILLYLLGVSNIVSSGSISSAATEGQTDRHISRDIADFFYFLPELSFPLFFFHFQTIVHLKVQRKAFLKDKKPLTSAMVVKSVACSTCATFHCSFISFFPAGILFSRRQKGRTSFCVVIFRDSKAQVSSSGK